MCRRTARHEFPRDPARIVRALRACRSVTMRMSVEMKIGCPIDRAAHKVSAAIEELANLIAGEKDYFYEPGEDGERQPAGSVGGEGRSGAGGRALAEAGRR